VKKVRLVVVDDHALFRAGLVSLLAQMPEFEVVGEAGNGHQALEVIQRTRPDIALIDVNMPEMGGVETVEALQKVETLRIVMLTISKHDDDLFGAIAAGAHGYLLKNSEPEELRRAILLVADGKSVLSPEVTGRVLKAVSNARGMPSEIGLSKREMEVLDCLAVGKTSAQIASDLFITENTVKTHVRHILEKLEAANRAEAVSRAIQMGLIRR
jgi:DNA-binding NarL/FixJ family response regulator